DGHGDESQRQRDDCQEREGGLGGGLHRFASIQSGRRQLQADWHCRRPCTRCSEVIGWSKGRDNDPLHFGRNAPSTHVLVITKNTNLESVCWLHTLTAAQ